MIILGIESSCDETSAAAVEDVGGKMLVRSNVVASQVPTHRLYGGVVPEIAGRAHIEAVSRVTYEALDSAGIALSDVDAIAVTSHPGLIGALLVGVNFAKSLAYANGLPLVAVNHVHAHTAAAYLASWQLRAPFLSLVVSGGHTSFYFVKNPTEYVEIGGTRDDAAGEAFDKLGRVLGMPYPAGAEMDKLATEGFMRNDWKSISLPSPAIHGDEPTFSFSGLKTAALNLINSEKQRGEEPDRTAYAAAITHAIVSAVAKKLPYAIAATGCRDMVLAGGVAANSHLRRAVAEVCEKHGVRLTVPPVSLCGDNAAMVAAQGFCEYRAGNFADTHLNASALD